MSGRVAGWANGSSHAAPRWAAPRAGRRLITAAMAVGLLLAIGVGTVAAAGTTLRVDPPSVAVDKGTGLTVTIIVRSSQPLSGAQATLTFDPTIVQVSRVALGSAYRSAPVFVPSDMAAAIATANRSGRLSTIAAAFLPPAVVPPGDAPFLVIGLTAVGCGTTPLGLPVGTADAVTIDGQAGSYGSTIGVSTTGGSVTVACGSGGASGGAGSAPGSATPGSGGAPPVAPAVAVAVVLVGGGAVWRLVRRRSKRP